MKKFNVKPKSFWVAYVEKQEHSGLSQAAYYRKEGLHPTSFGGWRRRLKKQAPAGTLRFVSLAPNVVKEPELAVSEALPPVDAMRFFFNGCLLSCPAKPHLNSCASLSRLLTKEGTMWRVEKHARVFLALGIAVPASMPLYSLTLFASTIYAISRARIAPFGLYGMLPPNRLNACIAKSRLLLVVVRFLEIRKPLYPSRHR